MGCSSLHLVASYLEASVSEIHEEAYRILVTAVSRAIAKALIENKTVYIEPLGTFEVVNGSKVRFTPSGALQKELKKCRRHLTQQ